MGVALFTNNASTTLSAGVNAIATTIPVAVGTGALFPAPGGSDYFYVTIVRASDSAREIVKCTARAGDSLTVTRAQEGTTALVFAAADRLELRVTAGALATKLGLAGGALTGALTSDSDISTTANIQASDLAATDDLTVGDDAAIGGDLAVTGAATVGGDLAVGGKAEADLYASVYSSPAAYALDLSMADHFVKTVGAAPTWTITNPPAAGKAFGFTLRFVQATAYAHTWPAAVKWVNGAIPTFLAGTHIIYFFTDDGGTNYWASAAKSFA